MEMEWILIIIAVVEVIWSVVLGYLHFQLRRAKPYVDIEYGMCSFDCDGKGGLSRSKPTRHCISDLRLTNNGTGDARHIRARYFAVVEGGPTYDGIATKRGQTIHLGVGKDTTIKHRLSFVTNDDKSLLRRLYWVVSYADAEDRRYVSFAVFGLNVNTEEWIVEVESFAARAEDKKAERWFFDALGNDIQGAYEMEDYLPLD